MPRAEALEARSWLWLVKQLQLQLVQLYYPDHLVLPAPPKCQLRAKFLQDIQPCTGPSFTMYDMQIDGFNTSALLGILPIAVSKSAYLPYMMGGVVD